MLVFDFNLITHGLLNPLSLSALNVKNEFILSISDVHLESSGSGSGSGGRETKSSLSVESGGSSSRGGGCLTWTPPAGSAEGSTPTWTEGTPSFTESSSSGDIGKLLYALNIYYGS